MPLAAPLSFALRVNVLGPADISNLNVWLSKHCSTFLVCRELEQSNDHCHVYGVTDLSYKVLQTSFRRSFPEHIGNESYSLKQCDAQVHDYLKYMCKGDSVESAANIVCRQGLDFTDEYLAELHAAYWVSNAELMQNSRKRDNLKMRGTVVEQLEKECKAAKLDGSDREAVAKLLVQKYVEARKPVNVYQCKSVVNTVCALLNGHQFDCLVSEISELRHL